MVWVQALARVIVLCSWERHLSSLRCINLMSTDKLLGQRDRLNARE